MTIRTDYQETHPVLSGVFRILNVAPEVQQYLQVQVVLLVFAHHINVNSYIKDKQRDAVIDTIQNNFPLNVMYWAIRDDGTFEIIAGQQRTISIAQYVQGDFSL